MATKKLTGSETTTASAAKSAPKRAAAHATTKKGAAALTIADIANAASSALTGIGNSIPLDVTGANGVTPARIGTRVPDAAMTIVQALLVANQARFPDLSATTVSDALAYEAAMTPFVQQLTTLATDITQTIRHRRSNAGKVTLGVYSALKTLAKVAPASGFPTQLQQLAPLLTTSKKSRATAVTQPVAHAAVKAIKVQKVAAKKATVAQKAAQAAGGAFVTTPPPASPPTAPATPAVPTASTH